jgi:uncharacterized membrane protein
LSIWVAIFLFLHVLGAIVAFGPVFTFPIIGGMAGKEPQHSNFAARINDAITDQRVEPLAIFQGITGVALILATGIDLLASRWLILGIVLYLIALSFALFVQRPTGKLIVELSSTPPPPGASGPPPALMAAVKKAQRGGMFLTVMIVLIVILMVVKPQF